MGSGFAYGVGDASEYTVLNTGGFVSGDSFYLPPEVKGKNLVLVAVQFNGWVLFKNNGVGFSLLPYKGENRIQIATYDESENRVNAYAGYLGGMSQQIYIYK